jgi:hypothetical protein
MLKYVPFCSDTSFYCPFLRRQAVRKYGHIRKLLVPLCYDISVYVVNTLLSITHCPGLCVGDEEWMHNLV